MSMANQLLLLISQSARYNTNMTRANFKEGHPVVTWKPNLVGHQQKHLGKNVISSLEERTEAIKQEIIKKDIVEPIIQSSPNP